MERELRGIPKTSIRYKYLGIYLMLDVHTDLELLLCHHVMRLHHQLDITSSGAESPTHIIGWTVLPRAMFVQCRLLTIPLTLALTLTMTMTALSASAIRTSIAILRKRIGRLRIIEVNGDLF